MINSYQIQEQVDSMRILILSDIHANLAAFQAVLNDATGQWDSIWFLGDLVGYGPNPNECVDLLCEYEHLGLAGNHDWAVLHKLEPEEFNPEARQAIKWTSRTLGPQAVAYLDSLPASTEQAPFTLAHGSPRAPIWEYITDLETALENFNHFTTPYCLVGHTHVPMLIWLDEAAEQVGGYVPAHGEKVPLERQRLILNPGSVGQPRDGDPRAAYALLDTGQMVWEYRRVVYDVTETQKQMRALKLPNKLVQRLAYGV
jgi:diadenosine tetraphosphatase ApaH/serine/threonine PP2A family protein phosphatase